MTRLILLCFALVTSLAQAQSDADLRVRLLNKPLYLSGAWASDKLTFDSTGHPRNTSNATTYTLAGIAVTKVSLQPDKLILEGQRYGIRFVNQLPKRVPLEVDKGFGRTESEKIHIEIERTPASDMNAALDTIFYTRVAQFLPQIPPAWEKSFRSAFLPKETQTSAADPGASAIQADDEVLRIGGTVLPPRLLKQTDPAYNNVARALRVTGEVIIDLHVEADGMPSHIEIVRPVGLGLDEQAARAVSTYRFAPATREGQPVPVMLRVAVNFQIF